MGYRSQVACVISVDSQRVDGKLVYDQEKFKEMIGFIKLSRFWELWNHEGEKDAIGWQKGAFVMYGDGWKWYPDYEDVKEFHNMFNQMQNIEGISGYFLRVGEEHGDVEEDHFGDDPQWDMFHAYTGMAFNGDEYLGKRTTEHEEKQNPQGELDLSTPTSQGDEKATPAT